MSILDDLLRRGIIESVKPDGTGCISTSIPAEVIDKTRLPRAHSVEEFLTLLDDFVTPALDNWYRGHASDVWQLLGSVYRTAATEQNERILLKRFMQDGARYLVDYPGDPWEWVMLAQHHHVPTRLLDWTENPLVGLFFAALDHEDILGDDTSATDGIVWILRPTLLNEGVDTTPDGRDLPMLRLDNTLNDYSPFSSPTHDLPTIAVLAPRTFARITSQWGNFTIGTQADALDASLASGILEAIRIPLAAKSGIRQRLASLGIEDRTVFPELFRLGERLKEMYT